MSPDLEHSSGPGGQAVANDYDNFAEAYTAANESSLLNGYSWPAVLDLAGDVAGRRILDVGCGAGPVLAALRDHGAVVTGVDHPFHYKLQYRDADYFAPASTPRSTRRASSVLPTPAQRAQQDKAARDAMRRARASRRVDERPLSLS